MNEESRHIEPMTNEVPPTPALRDAILRLAAQSDIRSISCPFEDFDLWKGLLAEQAERAGRLGLPLREALCLIGPDTGIPGITATPFADDTLRAGQARGTGAAAPQSRIGDVHIPGKAPAAPICSFSRGGTRYLQRRSPSRG